MSSFRRNAVVIAISADSPIAAQVSTGVHRFLNLSSSRFLFLRPNWRQLSRLYLHQCVELNIGCKLLFSPKYVRSRVERTRTIGETAVGHVIRAIVEALRTSCNVSVRNS